MVNSLLKFMIGEYIFIFTCFLNSLPKYSEIHIKYSEIKKTKIEPTAQIKLTSLVKYFNNSSLHF